MAQEEKTVKTPLPTYVTTWLNTFESKSTKRNYAWHIRILMRCLPNGVTIPLATVDDISIASTVFDLEEPSPYLWNPCISAWRSLYTHLIERRMIDENPCRLLKLRHTPDKPMDCPEKDDIQKIWEYLGSKKVWNSSTNRRRRLIIRDRAIFALLVACALRNSEIRNLRTKDVSVENRVVLVHRKKRGIKAQPWPISADPYILPILIGREPDEFLFVTQRGNQLTVQTLNMIIGTVCESANVRRYTAHAFRRFAGSDTRERLGLDATADLLGHANLETSRRYDQGRFKRKVTGELYDGRGEG